MGLRDHRDLRDKACQRSELDQKYFERLCYPSHLPYLF